MTIEDARAIVSAYRDLEAAARNMGEVLLNVQGHERPAWKVSDLLQAVTCHPLVAYARGIDGGFTMGVISGAFQAEKAKRDDVIGTDILTAEQP